jgi:TolB protein
MTMQMTRKPMRLNALAAMGLAIMALAALPPCPAMAQTEVDVNSGAIQPLPIAIPAFGGPSVGADVSKVVADDLESSGLFRPLDPATFPEKSLDINVEPKLDAWKTAGAQALVNGQASVTGDGRLNVDFRLWDIGTQQQLIGETFTASPDSWRRIAHKIADQVYEKLTGEKGYFDTRVVFVAESGPKTHRITRLAIMDQDGADPNYLTEDPSAIYMSPRFSSTSQEITYTAIRPTGSSVYILNVETGRQETVGHFQGMVMASRFSPDGSKLAFSVAQHGNVDIYTEDLHNREIRRLTFDPAIDTSPSFSPNGSQIVFNSDRSGSRQLYVMNADGTGVHRISFGSGAYSAPVWGPNGDYIAFIKQSGDEFHVGVMSPDGSNERILSTGYLEDTPSWAPNGRVIMFERDSGSGPRLWTVDLTGQIQRQVPYPTGAVDPAWSPLLQ